jgi:hypothetical protein
MHTVIESLTSNHKLVTELKHANETKTSCLRDLPDDPITDERVDLLLVAVRPDEFVKKVAQNVAQSGFLSNLTQELHQ